MFHRSERLLLRPGWIEDAAELTARIAVEDIVRNLARVPWPYGEEDSIRWLSTPKDPRAPVFLLTLPGQAGAPIIGGCGLNMGEKGPEIGYWIAREWWGQGFATEAVRAVMGIARTVGYTHIAARHAADNPASGKVLRKAGFVPTGTMGKFYSLGRGEEVASPEYIARLANRTGDNDPSEMPKAA